MSFPSIGVCLQISQNLSATPPFRCQVSLHNSASSDSGEKLLHINNAVIVSARYLLCVRTGGLGTAGSRIPPLLYNFNKQEIVPMTICRQKKRAFASLLWLMITGAAFPTLCAASPILNEVVGSTAGIDVEFIELYGTPATSLDDLSIIVVESDDQGSKGTIDWQFDFGGGDIIGNNNFFLLGTDGVAAVYGAVPNVIIPTNSIENSSYTIALVQTSSISGGTVGGSEIVLDALGVTDGGPSDFFFFDAPVIGPDGPFLPAGGRRVVDGVDTDNASDWRLSDFENGPSNTPTPGTYAVPLPGTLVLLVAGLMGLQFRRKA